MAKALQRSLWILTTEYEPYIIGGLGTVATNLTKHLTRQWINAAVLSQNRYPRFNVTRRQKLRIIRFPKKALRKYNPSAIHRWMNKRGYSNPVCIHIHSVHFTNLAKYFRRTFNTPVIYTCHSLVALEKGSKSQRVRQVQLLKIANRIVVPSRWELAKLKKLYPFCANKTVVIKHGVNVTNTSKTRGPSYRLLFVGRLIPSKGIEPLLKAVALLKRRNKKVELHVFGKGNKRYLMRLKLLVKRLRIQSDVHWHGFQNQKQLRQKYASYGAIVMPSIAGESFGMVALEALASGVPLIATRSGGLSEIVNSKVAQVIPIAESRAIASAIRQMWNNPSVTRKRVFAGRKLASRYRWPRVAAEYKKLIKKVQLKKK